MPSIKRLGSLLAAGVIAVTTLVSSVSADEAYYGYNYDWWGDPVPSQNGYVADKVVSGIDIGCGAFKDPNDFYFSQKGELYIADSGYIEDGNSNIKGRIVKTDGNFGLLSVYKEIDLSGVSDWVKMQEGRVASGELTEADFKKITNVNFSSPYGLFVDEDDMLYIADKDNDRVIAAYQDNGILKVKQIYIRPTSDVYDSSVTFNPRKVVIDKAKNVYVCIKSITQGAVVFAEDGSFNGYYGANSVQATAEVLANAFWKLVMSREQVQKMRRAVPVEFANFDIDSDGFIYTVTEVKSVTTDVVKKINPAGNNIFTKLGYTDYSYGDYAQYYYNGQTYKASITDIEVADDGIIDLLDFTTGRVFQYDDECNLLFIFGGTGDQKGTFTSVNAVESKDDRVYVLDGRKASITVFKQTEFGSIVHKAIELFNKGKYEEAREPWEEVMRRDANYWFAYIGIGNAYLNAGDYETAMDYFYYNSRGGYNQAFKGFRMDFIRDNFNIIITVVLIIIVALIVLIQINKRRKLKKLKAGLKEYEI